MIYNTLVLALYCCGDSTEDTDSEEGQEAVTDTDFTVAAVGINKTQDVFDNKVSPTYPNNSPPPTRLPSFHSRLPVPTPKLVFPIRNTLNLGLPVLILNLRLLLLRTVRIRTNIFPPMKLPSFHSRLQVPTFKLAFTTIWLPVHTLNLRLLMLVHLVP